MRCYFDLIGPKDAIDDSVGVEIRSVEDARRDAMDVVREFKRNPLDCDGFQGWRLRAHSPACGVLFVIDFDTEIVTYAESGLIYTVFPIHVSLK